MSSEQIFEQTVQNRTLDAAEQRAASTTGRDQQAQEVATTRAVLEKEYQTAKQVLPTLEYAIRQHHQPFAARVVGIAQSSGAPVPDQLRQWLTELDKLGREVPHSVRQGIRAVDGLAFSHIAGPDRFGNSGVDHNKQQDWIARTRQLLNSHDGARSRMKSIEGQIEFFIRENNWP